MAFIALGCAQQNFASEILILRDIFTWCASVVYSDGMCPWGPTNPINDVILLTLALLVLSHPSHARALLELHTIHKNKSCACTCFESTNAGGLAVLGYITWDNHHTS